MSGYDLKKAFRLNLQVSVFSSLTAVVGILALVGWAFDRPFLATIGSNIIPMAPSTAILFVLLSILLFLQSYVASHSGVSRIVLILVGVIILVSLTLLVLSLAGVHLQAESLGLAMSGTINSVPVGHMSPVTALCFILAGAVLWSQLPAPYGGRRIKRYPMLTNDLSIFLIEIGSLLLFAYLLGTPILYGTRFVPPAATTSIAFLSFGIATLSLSVRNRIQKRRTIDLGKRNWVRNLSIFFLLAAGIVLVGFSYFNTFRDHSISQVENELKVISDLKTVDIQTWREEQYEDTRSPANNKLFAQLVHGYLYQTANTSHKGLLENWLVGILENNEFDSVQLFDRAGNLRLIVPTESTPPDSGVHPLVMESIRTGDVHTQDLYWRESRQKVFMAILCPVKDPENPDRVIAILRFRIDPTHDLFPLIKRSSVFSKTAESLILRRDGDDVLFLNDLRFRQNSALRLRIPLTQSTLPAAMAVMGDTGIVYGNDYRGHEVIAYISPITNSPWYMVSKMDTEEVFAPLKQRLLFVIGLVLFLLLAAAGGLEYFDRQRRTFFNQQLMQSSEALHKSEERFRNLYENATIGLYRTSPTGEIVMANPALVKILGYSSFEELAARNLETEGFSPSYSRAQFQKEIEEHNEIKGLEVEWMTRDGNKIYVRESAQAIRDAHSNIVYYDGTVEDVTKRHEAEDNLRSSEEKYRALVQSSPDAILVNKDGAIILVNQACLDLFGAKSADELIGRNPIKLFPKEYHDVIRARIRRLLKSGKPVPPREEKIIRLDGGLVDVEVVASPFPYEGTVALHVILRDISERKQAEAAIRAGEIRYRDILNNMLEGCQTLSFEYRYLYLNDSAIEYAKIPRIELLGETIMDKYPGIEASELFQDMRRTMEERVSIQKEHEFVYPDGEVRWFENIIQPVEEGIFILSLDVTERKAFELEMKKINAELEERVQERTAQLEASNQELEAFAYSVAHDLRAPLRAITGFSDILQEEKSSQLDEEGIRYLGIIQSNVQRMDELIIDLLALSRATRTEMNVVDLEMTELVQSVYSEIVPFENAKFIFDLQSLPKAVCDPVLIRQVWVNLLSNAVKFSSKVEKPHIEVQGSRDGEMNVYTVRDNGAGFNPDYADKLFGIFQRLHGMDEFQGTGIGLAIVKRIVARHGGQVRAEGNVGEGAQFTFTLPIKEIAEVGNG